MRQGGHRQGGGSVEIARRNREQRKLVGEAHGMPRTSARSADSLKNPVSRRLRYVKHPDPIRWCANGPRNRSVSDAARVILKIFAMGIVQRRPTRSILKQYEPVLAIAKFSSGHKNCFRPHVAGRA